MSARTDLIRWIFDEAWTQGRTTSLADRIGQVVFHYGGTSRETDGVELATLIDSWRAGFPDLVFEICDIVEEGAIVATRNRLRGTHLGEWRGHEPTGREMAIDVMMFFRFEGSRLVEIWEVDDALRRDQQLGLDRAGR